MQKFKISKGLVLSIGSGPYAIKIYIFDCGFYILCMFIIGQAC